MKKYLIDTNIVIYYLKGKFGLDAKFESISADNLYLSEISLAELKFGVEKSDIVGATAVTHKLIMVTNNTDHFSRINGIKIEDWAKESEFN